jgi:hypothetical protein
MISNFILINHIREVISSGKSEHYDDVVFAVFCLETRKSEPTELIFFFTYSPTIYAFKTGTNLNRPNFESLRNIPGWLTEQACWECGTLHNEELFFFLWDYWHCGHSWPIVPASGDSEDDCGEQMKSRLAGETEVLGENLPQRHFCPSQNPTCLTFFLLMGLPIILYLPVCWKVR